NQPISFPSTIDGPAALIVTTSGDTTFNGAIGSGIRLASLTTNGGGATIFKTATVKTSGAQFYNDAVQNTVAITFDSNASGTITFANTLGGTGDITVKTAGTTLFGGAVTGTGNL